MKTLESKGKARYGPEHSGFTPEPRVEKKKKRKRVSSRAVLSDEDSVGRIKNCHLVFTNRLFTGNYESAKA